MEQVKCKNCDGPVMAGDRFCGECGAPAPTVQRPAPWPGTTSGTSRALNREQDLLADTADASHPFFGHASGRRSERLSNATRYLCAAAYLDRVFASQVIRELIASHRAVVPSVSFDLGPIIRHCLRARKIILVRDIILAVILVLGIILSPLPTINFLLIAFVLGVMLPNLRSRRMGLGVKLLVAVAAAAALGLIGLLSFFLVVGSFFASFLTNNGSLTAAVAGELGLAAAFIVLPVVTWATELGFTHTVLRTLSERLRPGAAGPRPTQGPAEARIATVEAAQWGNVTLYGRENPFIGTGAEAERHWSIAIELDRARPARQELLPRSTARGYVPIDPVELHQVIRERLLKLYDPSLPPNERISGLAVDDHVVGSGVLRWTSPLLDTAGKTPYSQASPEAIRALIRHPQARLRHYQRVSVSDEGPPVVSGGREVIESVDQGIAVSAFVHVAVEGRMFYLEFFRTALPPIKRLYQSIDQMPNASSGRFWAVVIKYSLKSLFRDVIYSPVGIYAALRQMRRDRRLEAEVTSPDGSVLADFGAQLSVRELGAADSFDTYIQLLDVEKYTKIIERLLVDTVLDFLAAKGVDTSAFVNSATNIINGDVNSVGTVSGGQVQIGHDNVFNKGPGLGVS